MGLFLFIFFVFLSFFCFSFLKATWNEVRTLKSEPVCNSIKALECLLVVVVFNDSKHQTVQYSTPSEKKTYLSVWESLLGLFYFSSTCSRLRIRVRFQANTGQVEGNGQVQCMQRFLTLKCSNDSYYCAQFWLPIPSNHLTMIPFHGLIWNPRYHFQNSLQKLLVLCVF